MTGLKLEPGSERSGDLAEEVKSESEVEGGLNWLRRHIEELGAALSGRRDALRDVFEKGEEILSLASETSGAMIYEFTLDNDRFRRMFGLRRKLGFDPDQINLTHDWWCDQIHPEDQTQFRTGFAAAVETGAGRARYRIRASDGRYIAVEDVMKARGGSPGAPRSLIGCIVDDSRQTGGGEPPDVQTATAEEARWRCYAGRLESVNGELHHFTSLASSVLMDPLRKIQVFGQMLSSKWGKSKEAPEYLARMRNAAARMQRVLQALQVYAEIDKGDALFTDVDLERVVRDALNDLEERIKSRGAQVGIGPLPHARVNERQVGLLFRNLIENGVRFQSKRNRPQIRIYAAPDPQSAIHKGHCRILVEDNGIGFDPKDAEKIFAPFHRLHSKNEYDGIGMGLAICRKIMDRHGGSIMAKGAAGKGSIFTVTFP